MYVCKQRPDQSLLMKSNNYYELIVKETLFTCGKCFSTKSCEYLITHLINFIKREKCLDALACPGNVYLMNAVYFLPAL